MEAIKNALLDLTLSAFGGFDKMLVSAQDVLAGNSFAVDTIWQTALAISEALKPFCYCIIAICILIELAQTASKVDIIKFEHGIKLCVKMVLARVCIDIAPTFLKACYVQSVDWINAVAGAGGVASFGTQISSQVRTQLESVSGLWQVLGLFMSTMLVALAIKVCGMLITVIAYGRFFEILVYLVVSPLPCAFFPLGDGAGGGWSRITQKFFKSFIAVCLQGVMILICIRLFNSIVAGALQTLLADAMAAGSASGVVSELCFTMLLFTIVLVMAVTKCGSWAKGIVDAM